MQLYLHQRHGTGVPPGPRAQGLPADHARRRRVAHASSSPLGPDELRYWNAAVRDWVIDRTIFDVWVGGDSTAALTDGFTVG